MWQLQHVTSAASDICSMWQLQHVTSVAWGSCSMWQLHHVTATSCANCCMWHLQHVTAAACDSYIMCQLLHWHLQHVTAAACDSYIMWQLLHVAFTAYDSCIIDRMNGTSHEHSLFFFPAELSQMLRESILRSIVTFLSTRHYWIQQVTVDKESLATIPFIHKIFYFVMNII